MGFECELRSLLDRYLAAYAAKEPEGCAAIYHPQGEIHSPFGPPAHGRTALAAVHADWFQTEERNKRFDLLSHRVEGGLAFALLRYSAETDDGPETGTSLNVLERDATTGWCIRISSLTPDMGAAE